MQEVQPSSQPLKSEIHTLYSPLPAGQRGKIVCTYDGNSVIIWREWKSERVEVQKMEIPAAFEIYFLGPDLIIVTDVGSIAAIRAHDYQFYTDPHLVSPTDRITSLAAYQCRTIAVGCRSGQVRIIDIRSGQCSFDQFRSPIGNIWWTGQVLNIVTECQSRWVWFRATEPDVYPHLLERVGFASRERPSETIDNPPTMQIDHVCEGYRRHKLPQWMRPLRVRAERLTNTLAKKVTP